MLHEFITANVEAIIARTRAKVDSRTFPLPTEAELKNGVPLLLMQLVDRLDPTKPVDGGAIEASATLHGGELLAMGFTVRQVIDGYRDVCQVMIQLAAETQVSITADEFMFLNHCLDDAIASSVTEFQRRHDESVALQETERQGILAHEMRNRLSAAVLAYSLLKEGTVGISGSTGAILGRNLHALRDLINKSLIAVRTEAGVGERRRISVHQVVHEAGEEGFLEAAGGTSRLVVSPVAPDIEVKGDRLILGATLSNLLLNAFKFNRPSGQVFLRATATDARVLIEVEDQCGGLAPGKAEDLFLPFAQRNANRAGLGLGLAISRKGMEAMGGTLQVRDLPGKGCVFFIDLPDSPRPDRCGALPAAFRGVGRI